MSYAEHELARPKVKERFEKLVEQGIIQVHRDEEMRWRVSKNNLMGHLRQRHRAGETRLVLEDRYQEVVMRICAAKKRIRSNAMVMIVDNEMAYIGSANVTPAGLGQGVRSPGNFEAGILTENPEIIASLNAHFTKVWNGDYCDGCHRANNCVEY